MKYLIFSLFVFVLFSLAFVIALPGLTQTLATVNPSDNHAIVLIPRHAMEVAPGVFSLGSAVDPQTGRIVDGYAIVKYKEGNHHRAGHGGAGSGETKCFSLYAKGARWKTTESYAVDTTNNDNMTSQFVLDTLGTSLETWDSQVAFDIFGARDTNLIVDGADTSSPDGKNEVLFADISSSGAIAVTILWGFFSGPPQGRELVEWDQVYDDFDFNFGNVGQTSETSLGNTSVMDLQNVATHEDGHASGLSHPADTCTEETMYRFTTEGETKRRTLNPGDIAGVNSLYS